MYDTLSTSAELHPCAADKIFSLNHQLIYKEMWTSGHKFNSELKCVFFIVIDTEIPLRESDGCPFAVSDDDSLARVCRSHDSGISSPVRRVLSPAWQWHAQRSKQLTMLSYLQRKDSSSRLLTGFQPVPSVI